MKTVLTEVRYCKKCGRDTIQHKNDSKVNWLLHIFLVIATAGLWIIPTLFIALLSFNVIDFEKWTCSICGEKS